MRKTKHRGIGSCRRQLPAQNLIAYNLIRIPKLVAAQPTQTSNPPTRHSQRTRDRKRSSFFKFFSRPSGLFLADTRIYEYCTWRRSEARWIESAMIEPKNLLRLGERPCLESGEAYLRCVVRAHSTRR